MEQPISSLMALHPRRLQLKEILGGSLESIFLWMQPCGGSSQKPTWIHSTLENAQQLFKPLDKKLSSNKVETVERYIDKHGNARVKGTKFLKGTQAYPEALGRHVAEVVSSNDVIMGPGVPLQELLDLKIPLSEDPWDDAKLQTIFDDLMKCSK